MAHSGVLYICERRRPSSPLQKKSRALG